MSYAVASVSPAKAKSPETLRGGVDLGGTKIEAIILDAEHRRRGSARSPTPTDGGPERVAAQIADVLTQAAREAKVAPSKLIGIGVGSPGDVNDEAGTVANAGNLPDWAGSYGLSAELKRRLGVPVRLGNDVQVATRAEFELGAGRPYRSLIMLAWGTGIGGGLILDGKLWLGRGGAGEIGHTVVRMGGAHCPCGRRGCLEAYAGRGAMEARARREVEQGAHTDLFKLMAARGRDRLTSSVWAHALDHGDRLAGQLVDRAVGALAVGLASAVNLLDVEGVVIGGGLGVRFGDAMARRVAAEMAPHLFNDRRPPAVHVAELGDAGGAIGASLLVAP